MSKPEVPDEYLVEVEGEDGTEVMVDLGSLWSSDPPDGWEINEGEIGLTRPEGQGIDFRRLCAGMLATSLNAMSKYRLQVATYEIQSFPGVDNMVVFDHVRAILDRAGVYAKCELTADPASKIAGRVVGPVAILDALASTPNSVIRRVDVVPPNDLKDCVNLIQAASRDDSPLLHELAWASTVRLYRRLGPLLNLVPPALEKAHQEDTKAIPMPEQFPSRMAGTFNGNE